MLHSSKIKATSLPSLHLKSIALWQSAKQAITSSVLELTMRSTQRDGRNILNLMELFTKPLHHIRLLRMDLLNVPSVQSPRTSAHCFQSQVSHTSTGLLLVLSQ